MSTRPVALALVLLVVTALAGCATIPVSSPVQTSAPQRQQDNPAIYVPNGPIDGMEPADVVRGFIQAQGAGRDYRVAKQFLTEDFADSWQPNESVVVHAAQWSVDALDDAGDRIRLTIPAVATVDQEGRYTPTSTSPTQDFALQQVRGQWRISSGPDGVVLSERVFTTVFTPVALQFFDPSFTRLVPDLRWFPASGNRSSAVVRAVLDGAAPPLRGVTAPVFPAGSELAAPVRSSDGITSVSVRIPGGVPAVKTTDRIQQALATPLGVATGSLRLVVNGSQVPVAAPAQLEQLSISDPVVVSGDRFGTLSPQGIVQEDRELGPSIVKLKPTAMTVSARQRIAAVLTGGGQVDIVTRQRVQMADDRNGLIAPTIDQRGWTYSIPSDDPGGLRVTDAAGTSVAVDTDLGGTEIISIEASTDGTRMLVLQRSDAGPKAYVAGILRNSRGVPIGLSTDRYPITVGSTDAIDATWVDQVNVALLTSSASAQTVVQQQLGGIATILGSLSNARTVVGATRPQELRALLGTGAILRLSSSSVFRLEFPAAVEVDVLAVQR